MSNNESMLILGLLSLIRFFNKVLTCFDLGFYLIFQQINFLRFLGEIVKTIYANSKLF